MRDLEPHTTPYTKEPAARVRPAEARERIQAMAQDISELKKLSTAGGALVKVAKVAIPAGLEFAKAPSIVKGFGLVTALYPVLAKELPKVLVVKDVAWPEVAGEALDVSQPEAVELVNAFFAA